MMKSIVVVCMCVFENRTCGWWKWKWLLL